MVLLRKLYTLLWTTLLLVASFSVADAFYLTTPSKNAARSHCWTILNAESSKRRSFLVASAALVGTLSVGSSPAFAKYGASGNLGMPSYIDYLIEKNSNSDDGKKVLYKGADPAVLLRRLQEADRRLDDISGLAEQKKWSQITGLLTGPLGTFSQTLNQIATPDSGKKVIDACKTVKTDLIAIGRAASQKDGETCIAKAQQTSEDLDAFVKVAFE
jgi:hypothetical protein